MKETIENSTIDDKEINKRIEIRENKLIRKWNGKKQYVIVLMTLKSTNRQETTKSTREPWEVAMKSMSKETTNFYLDFPYEVSSFQDSCILLNMLRDKIIFLKNF